MIAIYEANDDPSVITPINIWDNRPVHWEVDAKEDTQLFKTFPQELVNEMSKQSLAMHAHRVSLSEDSFL